MSSCWQEESYSDPVRPGISTGGPGMYVGENTLLIGYTV